jgi:hypothetical protein
MSVPQLQQKPLKKLEEPKHKLTKTEDATCSQREEFEEATNEEGKRREALIYNEDSFRKCLLLKFQYLNQYI